MSKDEAAAHIQGAWRSHRARALLRQLVSGVYTKGFDAESGQFFYYNSKTGESVWTKPVVLGDTDLDVSPRSKIEAKKSGVLKVEDEPEEPKASPRFLAKDLTQEEAAVHIQQAWRTSIARKRFKALVSGVWAKGYDQKRGSFFYYNKKSGESSWEKPPVLHDIDVELTPRSELEAIKARKLVAKPKTPRFKASDLSKDEAAAHIQGAWRSHRARALLRQLISGVYTKHLDPESGQYFYKNQKTGTSIWNKPAALGDDDVAVTARSKLIAKKSGLIDHITPRFVAKELTEEQAALHIQGAWRHYRARCVITSVCEQVYRKGYDEKTKGVFYLNTKTGQSVWSKPNILGNHTLQLSPRSEKLFQRDQAAGASDAVQIKKTKVSTTLEAAQFIQKWYRACRIREKLHQMIENVYTKGFDPSTNEFYYYNKKTGTSLWQKPKILGNLTSRLTPRSTALAKKANKLKPRRLASDLDDNEAAFIIQGMYRIHRDFRILQMKAELVWQKGYDPELDVFFYWNRATKESQWNKPFSLGSFDLELTPRSMIGAVRAGRIMKKPTRWNHTDMTPKDACLVIQSWWRGYLTRSKLGSKVMSVIYRCYDVNSKNFFWYNHRTGTSSWHEPMLLRRIPGIGDLPLTPRSMMLELHDRTLKQRQKRKLTRKTHLTMTKTEACFKIQGMYRGWVSRFRIRAIIRSIYEKLYDAHRGTYYYYNHRTGSSSWYKPTLLGSSDIRRSFVHSGTLRPEDAMKAALEAAKNGGYTIGEVMLRNGL